MEKEQINEGNEENLIERKRIRKVVERSVKTHDSRVHASDGRRDK